MNTLRTWHAYIGAFTAPTILFFALSGSFQLFNLHEKHGHYQPPAILQKLAQIHKDQAFSPEHEHEHEHAAATPAVAGNGGAAAAAPAASHDDDDDAPAPLALALKVFFLIVAISLIGSTLMGLWIGLSNARRKTVSWLLFAAGILVPVTLIMLA